MAGLRGRISADGRHGQAVDSGAIAARPVSPGHHRSETPSPPTAPGDRQPTGAGRSSHRLQDDPLDRDRRTGRLREDDAPVGLGGAGRPTVRLGVGGRGRRGSGGVPLPRGRSLGPRRGARRRRVPSDRIPGRRQPGPCGSPTRRGDLEESPPIRLGPRRARPGARAAVPRRGRFADSVPTRRLSDRDRRANRAQRRPPPVPGRRAPARDRRGRPRPGPRRCPTPPPGRRVRSHQDRG